MDAIEKIRARSIPDGECLIWQGGDKPYGMVWTGERTCRHCGQPITYLGPDKTVRNGWAHDEVNGSPWEEPCEVNPVTFRNKRGTKFAEPNAARSRRRGGD